MSGLGVPLASGVVSGGLHALALEPGPWWVLAWVALVPLLVALDRATTRRQVVTAAFAYTGALLACDVAPWFLPTVERYFGFERAAGWTIGTVAIVLTAAGYGALLAVPLVLRRRVGTRLGVVWCAALWSLWEPLRTSLLPPFFPLAPLPTSQASALPVLQIASVTGIAGVTALIVSVNAALAQLWSRQQSARRRTFAFAAVSLLALATTLWGAARLRDAPSTTDGPRVLLADGAATKVEDSTLERYVTATTSHVDGTRPPSPGDARLALVVWPESALFTDLERDADAWAGLSAFVTELGAPLVTGGIGSALAADGRLTRFNSVHFIRPRSGMLSYHKRVLVPFAESWPAALGAPPAWLDPVDAGSRLLTFGEGNARFGPLICFEITDAASVRDLARLGARFVVNVNNDVWFGGDAPHTVWARIRAIESGLPVVRATNGGTSAVVDGYGRVLASAGAASEPMVLEGTIPPPVDTIYVRTGEVFLGACAVVVLGGVVPRRRLRGA